MEAALILLHMSAILELPRRLGDLRLAKLCGRVRFPPQWSSGTRWWHTLSDYDLWFVWAGRGTMQLEEETIALSAGSCIWMQPGRRYITSHDPEHPLGVNFFHFRVLDDRGRDNSAGFSPPLEQMRVRNFAFADTLMQRILALRSEPDGLESADRLFAALLSELTRESAHQTKVPQSVQPKHVEKIHEIMSGVGSNPAKVASIAALAKRHGYSVSHFSRIFEAVAGIRPQQFLIGARLDFARQRLALTSSSIGAVATDAGFSDVYYFSRLFKQRVGVSPSVFRKNLVRS